MRLKVYWDIERIKGHDSSNPERIRELDTQIIDLPTSKFQEPKITESKEILRKLLNQQDGDCDYTNTIMMITTMGVRVLYHSDSLKNWHTNEKIIDDIMLQLF